MSYQPYVEDQVEQIMKEFHIGRLSARVLGTKDLSRQEMQGLFEESTFVDPMLAKGLKEVVERIQLAKANHEKVLICGDYDADGICATAILYQALGMLGLQVGYYIPNRFKEGYGLHPNTVQMAKEKGYQLLITVDNGVKAHAAANLAKELGLDLIITDHHNIDHELPPYTLLLHPQLMGEAFSSLSGAGVAFELSRALVGVKENLLVLACVAAIGDVMSLTYETRTIVKLGIQALQKGACKPVQRLANTSGDWDETKIAFQIVPKLNATGRLADMANANVTVRYLLSNHDEDINKCSKQIQDLNELRKVKSEIMTTQAMKLLDDSQAFQILYDETFHEGLTGLVAGKLASSLQQPIMVLGGKDTLRGSIRSVGDLDLNEFFKEGISLFEAYGGHAMAAGLSIPYDQLDLLRDYVIHKMKTTNITMDCIKQYLPLHKEDIQLSQVLELNQLRPFGEGFQPVIFGYPISEDMKCTIMSQGKHMKWSNDTLEIVFFNCEDQVSKLSKRKDLIAYGTLGISKFRSRTKISLMAEDIQQR